MCCHISEQCRHRTLSASQRSVHLEHSLLEKFIRRVSTPLIVPPACHCPKSCSEHRGLWPQRLPHCTEAQQFLEDLHLNPWAITDNWPLDCGLYAGDAQRSQLAGLASTGGRGYSAPTPRAMAALGRRG